MQSRLPFVLVGGNTLLSVCVFRCVSVPVHQQQECVYLYVRVQRLAQLCPLRVQLDQAVNVRALGRLLEAEPQRCNRAVTPPHIMDVLILRHDEVFTLRPAHT